MLFFKHHSHLLHFFCILGVTHPAKGGQVCIKIISHQNRRNSGILNLAQNQNLPINLLAVNLKEIIIVPKREVFPSG